jgi:predicted DCC family thiol-disulfide oxidoreductase YuxK
MKSLTQVIERLSAKQISGVGLGLFRIAFALVALQEVVFLFYFRHLIFDPIPYLDRASPVMHILLIVWMSVLVSLALGYQTYRAAILNYLFWIVFVIFTPMWQDFDGGFDQLMTGTSLLLIFLPSSRRLALDPIRLRWNTPRPDLADSSPQTVPQLAYILPLGITLGLLYLDSGIHKLSSEFWRNGMGAWLPSTMPYYMSPLDMSFLLNHQHLEMLIGYSVIAFQLVFLFLFWHRWFRLPLLLLGISFHIGIIVSLNVYPFGFGMLVNYLLMVPVAFWDRIEQWTQVKKPKLDVFYDEGCPLCRKTVLVIRHFDIRGAVDFKGLQSHHEGELRLSGIPQETLLTDLFSIDNKGIIASGLDTYIRILRALGYTYPLALLLSLPGIHLLAKSIYRRIADSRQRQPCDDSCVIRTPRHETDPHPWGAFLERHAGTPRKRAYRIAKIMIGILILQLNCTLHYGILYRWAGTQPQDPALALLDQASDSVINVSHAFLGISPHALYLHDHFDNYNEIVALVYRDSKGHEEWLPFVNPEGRLLTPNWGRIQSMWANVAITSHMSQDRLEKFTRKVTAYYSREMGINLDQADFVIKSKRVEVPTHWEPDLRQHNLSGPWTDIGLLSWRNGLGRLTLELRPDDAKPRDQKDMPRSLGTPLPP